MGVPPDHVLVLLAVDDGVVVGRLAFVGAAGLGVRRGEEGPRYGGAGEVPAVTRSVSEDVVLDSQAVDR